MSKSNDEFADFMDRLIEDARQYSPVAIAGDFNAWAVDWGSRTTNARGILLLEIMASLDVVLLNRGNIPTFSRGEASSIVDLTFVSSSLIKGNYSWEVMDTYTASDHSAILWEIATGHNPIRKSFQIKTIRWKTTSFDPAAFAVVLENLQITGNAQTKSEDLMSKIVEACDASMPRKHGTNQRPPVHWWNDLLSI